jgi:hypothetical protein
MDGDYELVKTLSSIVNNQSKRTSEVVLIKCLELYVKLLENVESHPGEDKYRKIKKKSKMVNDAFGSFTGAWDLLFKIGWGVKVLEFEEWIVWQGKDSDLSVALTWARQKVKSEKEKSDNAASSSIAAEKKEEAYIENLKRAVDLERKERWQKQHGDTQ